MDVEREESDCLESRLESSVKKVMNALLRDPVQQIIGKENLGQEPGDCQATDEKVLESFDKLINIINSLDVPLELLKSLDRSGSSISQEPSLEPSLETRRDQKPRSGAVRGRSVSQPAPLTLFCPVTACQFTISKDNPKSKQLAANHLKVKVLTSLSLTSLYQESHSVTPEMISRATPGTYKWKKFKS